MFSPLSGVCVHWRLVKRAHACQYAFAHILPVVMDIAALLDSAKLVLEEIAHLIMTAVTTTPAPTRNASKREREEEVYHQNPIHIITSEMI
ncbi:Hypothetical predicted protein [Mytilus galloprovincialis]|uniref:Uncharacterized protein n=1 Tax=Mytilus galloprovincialis TaxID=29158 RepID=A0A8B6HPK1_MYTGA|nr:Hypothetical predicted protein [Mytilus galloprovincialis]